MIRSFVIKNSCRPLYPSMRSVIEMALAAITAERINLIDRLLANYNRLSAYIS